uniref:F-box domain-containing protein n=1 Tax=Steinernema glaseri TaxID=37863 RepID=A0A1I7ZFL6_9BILA
MDFVPDAFVEALCAHLDWWDLETLQSINSSWTSNAGFYYSKRRKISVTLWANDEGTQVEIWTLLDDERVPFIIDPRYDQIEQISLSPFEEDSPPIYKASFKHFTNKVLPVLSSLAVHCKFDIFRSPNQNLTDILFDGLYSCVQLKAIYTANYGEKCTKFIEHQIGLGHVEQLYLDGDGWPGRMRTSIRSFLKSPVLVRLHLIYSNLTLDFDMVTGFIGRFLDGDRPDAISLDGPISFPLKDLRSFRPESLADCWLSDPFGKNITWARPPGRLFVSVEVNSPGYMSVSYREVIDAPRRSVMEVVYSWLYFVRDVIVFHLSQFNSIAE